MIVVDEPDMLELLPYGRQNEGLAAPSVASGGDALVARSMQVHDTIALDLMPPEPAAVIRHLGLAAV